MQGVPIEKAILHAICLPVKFVRVENPADAEVCIVADKKTLSEIYTEHQQFLVVSVPKNKPDGLPANAQWVNVSNLTPEFAKLLEKYKTTKHPAPDMQIETGKRYDPRNPASRPLSILVVDDAIANLKLALEQLGGHHHVTLAGGYAEAMELMQQGKGRYYDVVLTDLQMPAILPKGSSLSADIIDLDGPVHIGLFLMFEATRRGSECAIVTDADHHQDWMSALFDNFRIVQRINGHNVMFFNNIGKQWDVALKCLIGWA